jgi:hypothetical protein
LYDYKRKKGGLGWSVGFSTLCPWRGRIGVGLVKTSSISSVELRLMAFTPYLVVFVERREERPQFGGSHEAAARIDEAHQRWPLITIVICLQNGGHSTLGYHVCLSFFFLLADEPLRRIFFDLSPKFSICPAPYGVVSSGELDGGNSRSKRIRW